MKNRFSFTGSLLFFAGFLLICLSATTLSAQSADKRFIVLENGTVHDTKSGLNWAAKDNGANIIWSEAKNYCESYSEDGHNDWRMPTASELATLYGNRTKTAGKDYSGLIDVITPSISITAPFVWSSEKRTSNKSISFGFTYGTVKRLYRADGTNRRALPVR